MDSLSDIGVARSMRKLQSAFPKQSKEFFNVLAERLIANGFTDQRLTDAVNNLIDNFKFKELNIADIVKFDKKMKLYNYKEACKLVTEDGFEFGKDLQRISMDDNTYWIMKHK
jgi:aspartyl/asparaginyl-tRNA synthetase